jgi:hypothetical protein
MLRRQRGFAPEEPCYKTLGDCAWLGVTFRDSACPVPTAEHTLQQKVEIPQWILSKTYLVVISSNTLLVAA